MRQRAVLILLLIVASVLVDWAVLEFIGNSTPTNVARVLLTALVATQVGLASVWAGIGQSWIVWRLGIVVAVCSIGNRCIGFSTDPRVEWPPLFLAEAALVVLVLLSHRFAGWRLVPAGESTEARRGEDTRLQFTVRDFLGCTAVFAIVLATLREVNLGLGAGLFGILCGLIVLICAALILTSRRPLGPRAQILVALATSGLLYAVAAGSIEMDFPIPFAGVFLTTFVLLLTGALLVIRLAGYRLIVPPQASISPQPAIEQGVSTFDAAAGTPNRTTPST